MHRALAQASPVDHFAGVTDDHAGVLAHVVALNQILGMCILERIASSPSRWSSKVASSVSEPLQLDNDPLKQQNTKDCPNAAQAHARAL